jgi:hypothetical protein
VEEVGLSEPRRAVEEEGVPCAAGLVGDRLRGGAGELVRLTDDEGVEDVAGARARVPGVGVGRGLRSGLAGGGRARRRWTASARSVVDDEGDAEVSPRDRGEKLLEPGTVVVLDEVPMELVRRRDPEPVAVERGRAQRREPTRLEVGIQPGSQVGVDLGPEEIERGEPLGARRGFH